MSRQYPRRTFLSMTALGAAAASPWAHAARALATAGLRSGARHCAPFPLSAVRLRPGAALEALEVNRRFLMSLESDRLLHTFRLTAGSEHCRAARRLGGAGQ
jgi:hypothetical protein